jgi:DHA1 family bicyclomycin/chloramphenicol resistance-like MFS transporter
VTDGGTPNSSHAKTFPSTAANRDTRQSGKPPSLPKTGLALILGGLTACGPLAIDMYLPALPQLTRELGATSAQVQTTLMTMLLGLAFGQMLAGPISDSVGRRKPLLVGLIVYVAASVLCALSGSVFLLAALRFLQGLGAAAGMVIARAAVRDLYSGVEAARFFASLMLVTGVSPILAPVIGGQILRFTNWRGVFGVLAVLGVMLAFLVVLVLPETKPAQWRQPARFGATLRTFGGLLREPTFLGHMLAAGFISAAMFAYVSGSSFVFQGGYGLSPQQYSLLFGINSIGLVGGTQTSVRLVGRIASEAQLLLCALTSGALAGMAMIVAVANSAPLWTTMIALFVMIASMGAAMPNALLLALAKHQETSGSASALFGVSQFVIGSMAAPLVGLGGVGSPLPMVLVMSGVVLVAMAAHAAIGRRGLRDATGLSTVASSTPGR